MVWSPLGWGRLTGKIRRGQPIQAGRIASGGSVGGPDVEDEYLYRVVDALRRSPARRARPFRRSRSLAAVAANGSERRIGARNEEQLQDNLGAVGWSLS